MFNNNNNDNINGKEEQTLKRSCWSISKEDEKFPCFFFVPTPGWVKIFEKIF